MRKGCWVESFWSSEKKKVRRRGALLFLRSVDSRYFYMFGVEEASAGTVLFEGLWAIRRHGVECGVG